MSIRWSKEDLELYLKRFDKNNKDIILNPYKPKKSKYNNKRIKLDGHLFDSKKEADYYCELKLRLSAGDIRGFCIQPKFILTADIIYIADFIVFENDGNVRIVDVKGIETDVFKLKKRLFEEKFEYLELEIIKD